MECRNAMSSTPLRQMREQIADPFPAFAVLLELPLRLDDPPLVPMPAAAEGFDLHRLPVHADHVGLIVERIDMRRPAVHKQKDDTLRPRLKMRLLRRKRILIFRNPIRFRGLRVKKPLPPQKPRESHASKPAAGFPEEFAAGAAAEIAGCAVIALICHIWSFPMERRLCRAMTVNSYLRPAQPNGTKLGSTSCDPKMT